MDELMVGSQSVGTPRAVQKPLEGMTVLLVEDSRYFSDVIRLMVMRSGARLRRADTIATARRHLNLYTPDVVLVDLGLPDGHGSELISEIRHRLGNRTAIVGISGSSAGLSRIEAMEAGATAFLEKPFFDLRQFQQIMLAVAKGAGSARAVQIAAHSVTPDPAALTEDYRLVASLMEDALPNADMGQLRYCAQFSQSIARVSQDHHLMEVVGTFAARLRGGDAWQSAAEAMCAALRHRINAA